MHHPVHPVFAPLRAAAVGLDRCARLLERVGASGYAAPTIVLGHDGMELHTAASWRHDGSAHARVEREMYVRMVEDQGPALSAHMRRAQEVQAASHGLPFPRLLAKGNGCVALLLPRFDGHGPQRQIRHAQASHAALGYALALRLLDSSPTTRWPYQVLRQGYSHAAVSFMAASPGWAALIAAALADPHSTLRFLRGGPPPAHLRDRVVPLDHQMTQDDAQRIAQALRLDRPPTFLTPEGHAHASPPPLLPPSTLGG